MRCVSTTPITFTNDEISTPSRWMTCRSCFGEWPTSTTSLHTVLSVKFMSWIIRQSLLVAARFSCVTWNVSANMHSLKSVTSHERKSSEEWNVENCFVMIVPASGHVIELASERGELTSRSRVSSTAIPNSLTRGGPGLCISYLDTSRSI